MTRTAAFALSVLGTLLPQMSAAEDAKVLAATIIRDVCVETLPDFKAAIDRADTLNLLKKDSEDIALDDDTKVSLTVTDKQEVFGIPIEPLCVVNMLGVESEEMIETAKKLAGDLGTNIEQDGDGSDMEEDGITWYFDHGDKEVSLTLLEDSMLGFWKSAILSLSAVGDP